jgi:hypothetical protein
MVWFGSSGESGVVIGRPSFVVMRNVVLWWWGRRSIKLRERVGEERVLTVGRMGWRGGRGVHDYGWFGRRWM